MTNPVPQELLDDLADRLNLTSLAIPARIFFLLFSCSYTI